MKIKEIISLVEGTVVVGGDVVNEEVTHAFASDLMSDVLTIKDTDSLMLITGLANTQTIRTCEMSDIQIVLFVRGKNITDEMKELAEENGMVLIQTNYTLFRTSGILYAHGLSPLY